VSRGGVEDGGRLFLLCADAADRQAVGRSAATWADGGRDGTTDGRRAGGIVAARLRQFGPDVEIRRSETQRGEREIQRCHGDKPAAGGLPRAEMGNSDERMYVHHFFF
jgi:hypothetical protein